MNARVLGDLFSLDLKGEENPKGVHNESEIYRLLLDIRVWSFFNNDPALAWNRRRWANEAATIISESTQEVISRVRLERAPKAFFEKVKTVLPWHGNQAKTKEGSLRWYGSYVAFELLSAGKTVKEVSDIMWMTALGGIAVTVSLVRILHKHRSAHTCVQINVTNHSPMGFLDISLPRSCNIFSWMKTKRTGPGFKN